MFSAYFYLGGIILSKYLPLTKKQQELAANTDLQLFLLKRGERLIRSGRDRRLASDHSITIRGCQWFDHSAQEGGNAISFVQKHYNCGYAEAVSMLLKDITPAQLQEANRPDFVLPPRNENMRRVFAYLLKERCISSEVLSEFAHLRLVYEDAKFHNAVFVGIDDNGMPRHASKRSTNSNGKGFKGNVYGSDARYSFNFIGTDGSLYIFEAPIDLLSYITLHPENWQEHSYLACCGTSLQPVVEMLKRLPEIKEVYLCMDNDDAGQQMAERIKAALPLGMYVERLLPKGKDWNDDLVKEAGE